MLSNKQAYDKLEGKVLSDWTFCAVIYPNVDSDHPQLAGKADFCRLDISIGMSKGMDIGADGPSNIFSQNHGVLQMRFYIRKGEGESAFHDYQDKFQRIFSYKMFEGLSFTECGSVGPSDNTKAGDWRVLTCFANFHFSRSQE